MEDKSRSRTQAVQREGLSLSLRTSDPADRDFLKQLSWQSDTKILLGETNSSFTVIDGILYQGSDVEILKGDALRLPLNSNNLASLALLENRRDNKANKEAHSQSKAVKSFMRKVFQQCSRKAPQSNKAAKISKLRNDNKVITSILEDDSTIEELLLRIFTLDGFKDYLSIQLLIHEKGKPLAFSHLAKIDQSVAFKQVEMIHFNQLFNIVKKSKNKQFIRNDTNDEIIDVLGCFLAKNLELKNHRLMFIISRDDFLDPSREEKKYFEDLTKQLVEVFGNILNKNTQSDRERSIFQALLHYPQPLAISIKDNIIFKNKSFSEIPMDLDQFTEHQLGYERILFENKEVANNVSTQISHYERISLLGELLNTLRHELSNPLFGIGLATSLITDELPDEEQETASLIKTESIRCQKIIDNFSSLYAGGEQFSEINLETVCREALTLSKSETREIFKSLKIKSNNSLEYLTNPTWVTQIVFNLVVNSAQAIKSAGSQRAEITIEIDSTESSFEIHVLDNGPGVEKEVIEKIFTPYFTTKSHGTGLGLAICRHLAHKLNGRLEYCDSGNGAHFVLYLPH